MYTSDNDSKIKMQFRKLSLTTQWASKQNCSKICWSTTLMWGNGQAFDLEYSLQWFDTRLFLACKCDRLSIEYRLGKKKILDRIHARVGDRNLCILGGLFTIEIEMGIQTSISGCSWLVGSWRHVWDSYRDNHWTRRSSSVLI